MLTGLRGHAQGSRDFNLICGNFRNGIVEQTIECIENRSPVCGKGLFSACMPPASRLREDAPRIAFIPVSAEIVNVKIA